jgi:integrase
LPGSFLAQNRAYHDPGIIPAWSGRRSSSITRPDVHALLDAIADRGSPVMANRVLAAIRRLFNWATERDLVAVSSWEKVKAPAAETSRDRVLSDDELCLVWQGAETIGWPFGPIVQMLILTGQRRAEVAGMRWAEVDLANRIWTIPAARCKNNIEHRVPVSNQAIAILESLPRIAGSELIISYTGRSPFDGFGPAKVRLDAAIAVKSGAPVPDWRLHDLRRTFATGCARLGVQLPVVEKLLNHVGGSFRGVAGVYQRFDFASEQRSAVEIWARHVESVVTGETAGNIVTCESTSVTP